MVEKIWKEASTPGNESQLSLFIENRVVDLVSIRATIKTGMTDFTCEIKPKLKEKFIAQLTVMPDFKRIQELVEIKKKLAE